MAAGITYDGVQGETGGNIFKDMVFWVSFRVPMRNYILDLIKGNGGRVVSLEKDAQMLIADHLKKGAPPDSVSWQYITESVDNGIAQLTDRYLILTPARAGASAPVKLTRSKFTEAEDAALANWVLAAHSDRFGNKIYKEFAETHPAHTWSSWRHRFVRTLSHRPMEDLFKLAASAPGLAMRDSNKQNRPAVTQTTPKTTEKEPSAAPSPPQKTPPNATSRVPRRPIHISTPGPVSTPKGTSSSASPRERKRQSRRTISSPAQSEDVGIETQVNMKDRFWADLLVYSEVNGVKVTADLEVGGKGLNLWDLSQAVASQNAPPEEVDWMGVAEDLGFDCVEEKNVIAELQKCFQENLEGFFEAMSGFVDNNSEDGAAELESDLPPSNMPSSPPVESSKRKAPLDKQPLTLIENSAKRRHLSRITEIPPTPEERLRAHDAQSPSLQKALQIEQMYGTSSKATAKLKIPPSAGQEEDDDSEETLPEIQAGATPALKTRHSTFDITPSQQLHSEAMNITPIPLDLGRSYTVNDQEEHQQAEKPQDFVAHPKTTCGAARRSLPASFILNSRPLSAQEVETTVHLPTQTNKPEESTAKLKTTAKAAMRSLPASSFTPNGRRFSPQEAETRAQRLSRPIRVEPADEDQSQNIRDCVEYYEALGYSRPIVVESLMRTSMTPGWPATHLMKLLKSKEKIPSNFENVWTDRDDECLQYADRINARASTATTRERNKAKKELDRLIKKHTQQNVDLRRRFFAAQARMG